jgi:two-component system LytT family sensor kinase
LYWCVIFLSGTVSINPTQAFQFYFNAPTLFEITFFVTSFSTFYVHYIYILNNFFARFKLIKILVGFLLSFTFFALFRYVLEEVLAYQLFNTHNYHNSIHPFAYWIDNLHWATPTIIASTLIWLVINYIRKLQQAIQLEEAQKKAEIQFLKSQINPHFIFNTLNAIYALVYKKSDQALEVIEKLSEIMRFTTYETQKERIPIDSEIQYINSYIHLEAIRSAQPIYITTNYNIQNNQQQLPPYLLLPLIENCIKHGILTNEQAPVTITITCTPALLQITTTNEINNHHKDAHKGIGLTNLQKRLQLYYPNQHSLQCTNQNNIFTAQLNINFP